MSPATAAFTIFIGALVFSQIVLGDLVGRLLSYVDDEEPEDAGWQGSSFTPRSSGLPAKFVDLLLSQKGDSYVFGGETHGERNPNGYDCSEFIQWAMNRLGFGSFPDGSAAQIAHAKKIPVRRALRIRGAVLSHPGHIAVSMGDGKRVVEAQSTRTGVGVFSASGRGWTTGGLFPELFGLRMAGPRSGV